jgi:hypothetical protein
VTFKAIEEAGVERFLMLEGGKKATRTTGGYTPLEYARFADDLVVLVSGDSRNDWLQAVVGRRLREELGKLEVEINEEKSRTVDLTKGESFGFLGFDLRRVRSLQGNWLVRTTPKLKKRTPLLRELKEDFRRHRAQPIERVIRIINPKLRGWVNYFSYGNSARCFTYVRHWIERKCDDIWSGTRSARASAARGGVGGGSTRTWDSSLSTGWATVGHNRQRSQQDRSHNPWREAYRREPDAGKLHVRFDRAGAGDGLTVAAKRAPNWKRWTRPSRRLRGTAPAFDPTSTDSSGGRRWEARQAEPFEPRRCIAGVGRGCSPQMAGLGPRHGRRRRITNRSLFAAASAGRLTDG